MKAQFIVIYTILATSFSSMAAGECWYLKMPKKHADYLVSECGKTDTKGYTEAIARIPDLIKKGTIEEIEICLQAEGQEATDVQGKHHPFEIVELKGKKWGRLDGRKWHEGSMYENKQSQEGGRAILTIKGKITPSGQEVLTIQTSRIVGKIWSPTFVFTKDGNTHVLLERDTKSPLEQAVAKSSVHMKCEIPSILDISMTWLLTDETLPARDRLVFEDKTSYYDKHDGQFRYAGTTIMLANGDSKGQSVVPLKFDAQYSLPLERGGNVGYRSFSANFPREKNQHEAPFLYEVTEPVRDSEKEFTTGDKGQKGTFTLSLERLVKGKGVNP